jgi:hypothetical protein
MGVVVGRTVDRQLGGAGHADSGLERHTGSERTPGALV